MAIKEQYTISTVTGGKVYKKEEDTVKIHYQLLVYGYCRITTEYVMPLEITSLCQSYYRIEFDTWDATHSSVNYRINGKLLSRLWDYGSWKWSNAFGCKTIERYGHNVWKIKLVAMDIDCDTALCLFGIVCSDKIKIAKMDLSKEKYVRNQNLNKNDIVTLTLDLTKQGNGQLAYTINNKYLGVIFDHVNTDLDWKLAIAVSSNVQLRLCL
eukprot:212715_1